MSTLGLGAGQESGSAERLLLDGYVGLPFRAFLSGARVRKVPVGDTPNGA